MLVEECRASSAPGAVALARLAGAGLVGEAVVSACQRAAMFQAPPKLLTGSTLPCQSETLRIWIVTGACSFAA